jgi:hypothetical protein
MYIRRRSGYINLNSDDIEAQTEFILPDQNTRHKTIFETLKASVTKKYNYYYHMLFGKQNTNTPISTNVIPLVETTTSSHNNLRRFTRHSEQDLFDKHINELCANNSSIEFDNYITSNNKSNDESINDESNVSNNDESNVSSNNMFKTVDLTTNTDSFLNSNYFKNFYEPVVNKPYNVQDSNILFDSNFMTNQFKNVKDETYPKDNCNLSQSFPRSNLSQNLNIIREEQESQEESEKESQEENGKIVFHVNSEWDEKFPSEYKPKYKDTNDNLDDNVYNNVDDTYKNTILKNPYI